MASYTSSTINTGYWGQYPLTSKVSFDATRSGNTINITNIIIYCTASNGWGSDNYWPKFTLLVGSTSIAYGEGLSMTAGEGVKTLSDATFTVGATATSATITFKVENGGTFTTNINITFPSGGTSPYGGSVTWNSHTWNSVNITSKVTSWGTGYTGTPNLEQIIVQSSATSSTWEQTGRIAKQNATTSLSSTQSVSNTNYDLSINGGITVKGCTSYKIAMYANTNLGATRTFDNTIRYTPPAPLQSLSKASETYAGSNKSNVAISITGGNSTNNNNVTVSTQYRYSTNGGSSWTAWAQAGTGTPWTAKTATIQVPCSTSIQVQARQVYQSQASETKSLTFTSMKTPARLYVPVSGKSKLGRKAYIGINGQSEKVLKIYKGVNGRSKLVYTV